MTITSYNPDFKCSVLRDVRLELGPRGSSDHRLIMYDTYRTDRRGCIYVGYMLHDSKGKVVFSGEDYSPGACTAIDSDESIAGLLGFLSCGECDVEEDYFADYTSEQLAYRDEYAEELSLYSMDDEDERPEFKPWDDMHPLP